MDQNKRDLALKLIEEAVSRCVAIGTNDVRLALLDAMIVMEAVKTCRDSQTAEKK